ncbi:MAG: hypothetical protein HY608_06355, partial [Planctomycetes bacterium]|nr:hypothetical protein [Planctomycetota bacterium]
MARGLKGWVRLALGSFLLSAAACEGLADDPLSLAREAASTEYALRYAEASHRGGLGDLHVIPALIRNLTEPDALVR